VQIHNSPEILDLSSITALMGTLKRFHFLLPFGGESQVRGKVISSPPPDIILFIGFLRKFIKLILLGALKKIARLCRRQYYGASLPLILPTWAKIHGIVNNLVGRCEIGEYINDSCRLCRTPTGSGLKN
jgi:hypothetical protein